MYTLCVNKGEECSQAAATGIATTKVGLRNFYGMASGYSDVRSPGKCRVKRVAEISASTLGKDVG